MARHEHGPVGRDGRGPSQIDVAPAEVGALAQHPEIRREPRHEEIRPAGVVLQQVDLAALENHSGSYRGMYRGYSAYQYQQQPSA